MYYIGDGRSKKQKAKVKVVYLRTLVAVGSGMNQPRHVCSRLDN